MASFIQEFVIGKTEIGGKNPCFITAEIGINHDGKFNQAIKLIDSAIDAKCSAVKFQLFSAETMYAENAGELKTASGQKVNIRDIIKTTELPTDWIPKLKKYANRNGLEFFSTVCSEDDVDKYQKYEPDAYKIASYEITHIPLLRYVARQKKPVVFSSACSTLQEVADAVDIFREERNKNVVLMHCVGKYGANLKDLNLNIIKTLKLAFPDLIIGYSDHSSEPLDAPIAAVTLGAKMIEKHITLDRSLPGVDHSFALTPNELKQMVNGIRSAEEKIKQRKNFRINTVVLGTSERKVYPIEKYVRNFAYRSIFTNRQIRKGEKFNSKNISVLRPGDNKRGLEPKFYEIILNKHKASRNIPPFRGLQWEDILL